MYTTSAIIVAGGQSRRFGQDKRKLRLWGKHGPTLLDHTLDIVAALCNDCIVVLNDQEHWLNLAAHLVPDSYADAGALGGIYAGLSAAANEYALVVAADMPLLNPALLQAMLAWPGTYDALVPEIYGEREPMHAIYSKTCLAPLQAALEAGQRRVSTFLDQVQLETIPHEVLCQIDPHGHSFCNLNTPEDLVQIKRELAKRDRREV